MIGVGLAGSRRPAPGHPPRFSLIPAQPPRRPAMARSQSTGGCPERPCCDRGTARASEDESRSDRAAACPFRNAVASSRTAIFRRPMETVLLFGRTARARTGRASLRRVDRRRFCETPSDTTTGVRLSTGDGRRGMVGSCRPRACRPVPRGVEGWRIAGFVTGLGSLLACCGSALVGGALIEGWSVAGGGEAAGSGGAEVVGGGGAPGGEALTGGAGVGAGAGTGGAPPPLGGAGTPRRGRKASGSR